MQTENSIQVTNLSFAYGEHAVLQNVNLRFPANRFSVLLGRNGSGKSTLFNIIAGLLRHSSGSVELLGKETNFLSYAERARLIGFLPQFHKAVFPFQVRDVILTGRAAFSGIRPSRDDAGRVNKAMAELGIEHLAERAYTELSGGEQQLVMIARIMVQNPAVIILDEPTNHLDVYHQTQLLGHLKRLSRSGYTVIAIMHDPNLAFLHADHFYFMRHKTVVYPPGEQGHYDRQFLKEVYDVDFKIVPVDDRKIVVPVQ